MGARAALSGVFRRLWGRPQGQSEPDAAPPAAQSDQVGPLLPALLHGSPRRTVALVALGLEAGEIGAVVAQLAKLESDLGLVPLILTDMDNFELLASHRYAFEHFPSARSRDLAPAGLAWDVYLQRRLDLLQRKWQPVAVIPFGEKAGRALSTWRAAHAGRAGHGGSGWQGPDAGT